MNAAFRPVIHETSLYFAILPTQWPIVYMPKYNFDFQWLTRLSGIDTGTWGRVYTFLKGEPQDVAAAVECGFQSNFFNFCINFFLAVLAESGMIRDDTTIQPREAQPEDLLVAYSKRYVNDLEV